MCGIAGFINTQPVRVNDGIVTRMTEAIAHRGPDDNRFYRDQYAQLGHRRLSIIDVAAGRQPMSNEDGTLWIIYNGEIFNHATVRPELEAAGHRYETHCDTETVIHAYEQWGPESIERFRGMFSFVLWDSRRRKMFAARDRLGIKPFYYVWTGREFIFASEIKALLEHPAVSAEVEESLIPEYLSFGYTSAESTLFRGIRKLMPGHHLTLDLDRENVAPDIRPYWDIPAQSAVERRSEQSWIEECRRRLEETVRMRLMSDVPLGMFLSGGIDSSAVAALIKRMTSGPVKTFSVGYREEQYSELSYARQVATAIGTDHHEVVIGMDDFFNALPQCVWHEDEPMTWPSSISLYFVSKLAANEVKVVLTGEGSDELFGGYERYAHYLWNSGWMKRYGVVPGPLRTFVRNQIATSTLLSGNLRRKLKHTFIGRENTYESLQLDNFYGAFAGDEFRSLCKVAGDPYASTMRYFRSASDRTALGQMLYADSKTYLVELLMKQDQMSMAASIESRVPFLDHPFVEFATRVPDDLKIRNGTAKYILKKAVEDILPHDIVYRKKMGFPTPVRQWFRERRADRLFALLQAKDGFVSSYVDLDVMGGLIARHRAGLEDATDRIWRLLNLQIWGDVFIRGNRDQWQDGLMVATTAT
jgi:asparagine synthase (glutamine-hydrolysing)